MSALYCSAFKKVNSVAIAGATILAINALAGMASAQTHLPYRTDGHGANQSEVSLNSSHYSLSPSQQHSSRPTATKALKVRPQGSHYGGTI